MPARQRRRSRAAATGLVVLLAVGCSADSGPRFEASDLAAECEQAGPDLLAVERAHRGFLADDVEAKAAADAYQQAQPGLLAAREEVPDEIGAALRRLVTSLGFFRVGAAAGTLGDAQVDQVADALDAALSSCGVELDG